MRRNETCSALDIEKILMEFRELRCSSVNHMAIRDAKTSLLEIQRTIQNQFLTLTIGFLALVLTVIQTLVVTISTDITIRWMSLVIIIIAGCLLGGYLIVNLKTGRGARLREVEQKIGSADDAKNEYATLKITAEEDLIPIIEASVKLNTITQQRYEVIRKRIDDAVSFFSKKIAEKEKELKVLEEIRKG